MAEREKILEKKAVYNLDQLIPNWKQVLILYPELHKCQGCNTCTMSCPQDLHVMEYISDALRGDIAAVAEKSFDCIMCELCAKRCPAGVAPYNIGLLHRRLYGRYLLPRSQNLSQSVLDIEQGKFDTELSELRKMDVSKLDSLYRKREILP